MQDGPFARRAEAEGDAHLDVDVRGRERRDGDDRCDEERRVPLLRHEPDERAGDFFAALLAGGHVRQDRKRDDSHVDRDDGAGNRGSESESEEEVDPHPPGAGPRQQVGSTEAKEREHGGHGEDDQDLHRVPFAGAAGGGVAPGAAGGALGAAPGAAGGAVGAALPVRPEAQSARLPGRKPRPERRRARGSVVVMARLKRDRRRAAKGLEVGDHAEDLLIGEADRRLVDDGHARIESRHDEVLGFVNRLGEVLDIAQARHAGLRADIDIREVGEPERALRLADRVAGKAESLAVHDLAAHLGHVGRGQVGSDHSLLRRQNFLLRHHLADIGIERRRREDENADPDVCGIVMTRLSAPRNRAGRAGS